MLLSLIIPVYNRPLEIDELLQSLLRQTYQEPYEIIVVEDGSIYSSADVVARYQGQLPIRYLSIPNGGPSRARNIGAGEAQGEYIVILDSDVVLPEEYLKTVSESICLTKADAFGGPDAASPDFSPMQKAVNFAMTSFLTTGGIRGGSEEAMEKFKPRTFNMGCRRDLFLSLHGFSEDMRYGEDIDFSLRLVQAGANVRLFPEAYVYHKRRVDLSKFFRQVMHSGEARIELERRHPGSTKLVHYLPAAFTLFCAIALFFSIGRGLILLYALAVLIVATGATQSVYVGLLSVVTSFTQLIGYGTGFLKAKLQS